MPIWTGIALQNIWPVSDLGPRVEVAQNRSAVHTVMTKTDLSQIGPHLSAVWTQWN